MNVACWPALTWPELFQSEARQHGSRCLCTRVLALELRILQ